MGPKIQMWVRTYDFLGGFRRAPGALGPWGGRCGTALKGKLHLCNYSLCLRFCCLPSYDSPFVGSRNTPSWGAGAPPLSGAGIPSLWRAPALAWLACLLCLALAWSGPGLSCLLCQQQQQRRRSRRRPPKAAGCCCWTRPRQGRRGRQDRPRLAYARAPYIVCFGQPGSRLDRLDPAWKNAEKCWKKTVRTGNC